MIDISITEIGTVPTNNRKKIVDYLLRTDDAQKWTTFSTQNNVYVIPGKDYSCLPELEDRLIYRHELIMKMKDCPSDKLKCDRFRITVWKKGREDSLADILKTAAYEIRDALGEKKFFTNSYCFALHTENSCRFLMYRLYSDIGQKTGRVRDPLENLTEEELDRYCMGEYIPAVKS